MTIKILSFRAWLKSNADLLVALSKIIKPCDNCDGSGECECDLGHYHMCLVCNGTGNVGGIEDAKDQLRSIYEHKRDVEIAALAKSGVAKIEEINSAPDTNIEIIESLRAAERETKGERNE